MGFAAVVRTLAINIESTGKTHGVSLRLLSVATIATLLYASSRWSGKPDDGAGVRISQRTFSVAELASSAYTWAASGLLGLLAWYELRPVGVADAWLVGGLLLLEIGIAQKKFSLRLQSYVALLAAFARIFFVNMNADGGAGELSPRFYSAVPVALGFFYGYWRLREAGPELKELERRFRASEICCWLGTITIVALMRKVPNQGSIAVINIFLGWTVIGWVVALAMAAISIADLVPSRNELNICGFMPADCASPAVSP